MKPKAGWGCNFFPLADEFFFDFSLTRARISPNQLRAHHRICQFQTVAGVEVTEHAQHQVIFDY
jgi:hypothetical protein